jgi:hypothetical protein
MQDGSPEEESNKYGEGGWTTMQDGVLRRSPTNKVKGQRRCPRVGRLWYPMTA